MIRGRTPFLWCSLILLFGGCALKPSPYREFVATVPYSTLGTFVLEGPVVPTNLNRARDVNRFRERLRETASEMMSERGFEPASGLVEADMVLELEWRTSQGPLDPERVLDGGGTMEMGTFYHLNLRIFSLRSGVVFWRNAAAQPLSQKELTVTRVERMLRDTLGPLPPADDPVKFADP